MEESFLPGDKADLPVLSRAICRRARSAEGQVRKNSPDGHKAPIVVPGGPLYLRQEPAGSCEHAPRMNPGDICFPFVDKHIAFGVSEWRYVSRRRERRRDRMREKDLFPGTGTWPPYRDLT